MPVRGYYLYLSCVLLLAIAWAMIGDAWRQPVDGASESQSASSLVMVLTLCIGHTYASAGQACINQNRKLTHKKV